jgi:hypothetical protein
MKQAALIGRNRLSERERLDDINERIGLYAVLVEQDCRDLGIELESIGGAGDLLRLNARIVEGIYKIAEKYGLGFVDIKDEIDKNIDVIIRAARAVRECKKGWMPVEQERVIDKVRRDALRTLDLIGLA